MQSGHLNHPSDTSQGPISVLCGTYENAKYPEIAKGTAPIHSPTFSLDPESRNFSTREIYALASRALSTTHTIAAIFQPSIDFEKTATTTDPEVTPGEQAGRSSHAAKQSLAASVRFHVPISLPVYRGFLRFSE